NSVDVGEGDAEQLIRLVDQLEEDDDVQTVWGNYEMSDAVLEKLA
ncbi:MAG TPA: YebC/PmpR family DNA-binding transcriptional regulator, partial [Allosphingosinicella sp.]|nr:YebC/PmpR family DNA-binding transcriptional regulator [Allosphingosinicella sp.]